MSNSNNLKKKICVVGLGYVGFPLLFELSKSFNVLGFDINQDRIDELKRGIDKTNEINLKRHGLSSIKLSSSTRSLNTSNFYIVTVPTPINRHKQPDLEPLRNASRIVGRSLNKGDIVVFESTVFPGATEEFCVPILENESGLELNKDFSVGYSPERINPGDKEHTIRNIKKLVSGSNKSALKEIKDVYSKIIDAGVIPTKTIKVAEAAKVIENTQRDINIALINELSQIFDKLNINTKQVLEAASTKWNFLDFEPGLVGGHCIGVDPYYLTHKAQEVGHHPEIILAGRRINDKMPEFIVEKLLQGMVEKSINIPQSKVLILGYTFKPNCPDIRNTKVRELVSSLKKYVKDICIYDPWIQKKDIKTSDVKFLTKLDNKYDAIIICVPHQEFLDMGIKRIRSFRKSNALIFDVKSVFPEEFVDLSL